MFRRENMFVYKVGYYHCEGSCYKQLCHIKEFSNEEFREIIKKGISILLNKKPTFSPVEG